MKIVAFNGSPRPEGNIEILLNETLKPLREAGHDILLFNLNNMDFKPCQDCGGCIETGICIHEEAAFRNGRIFSVEEDRTLLNWAKELGCNFVRLAHYPHNEQMVREAEKLGVSDMIEQFCVFIVGQAKKKQYLLKTF